MKGGGALCSKCSDDEIIEDLNVYDNQGNPYGTLPDNNIYIKTTWKRNNHNLTFRELLTSFTDNIDVSLADSNDYNWKLTPVNGNIDNEIDRLISYYTHLIKRMSTHDIAFDDINNTIVSRKQVILKLYQLHAIREYFNRIENYTTAQRIGGKRRKKTKNKLKKKRKTIKKKK